MPLELTLTLTLSSISCLAGYLIARHKFVTQAPKVRIKWWPQGESFIETDGPMTPAMLQQAMHDARLVVQEIRTKRTDLPRLERVWLKDLFIANRSLWDALESCEWQGWGDGKVTLRGVTSTTLRTTKLTHERTRDIALAHWRTDEKSNTPKP